jgi:hypothetical protein
MTLTEAGKVYCECGHAKGQHDFSLQGYFRKGRCDYAGHSCMCDGYKRIDEWKDKRGKNVRKA